MTIELEERPAGVEHDNAMQAFAAALAALTDPVASESADTGTYKYKYASLSTITTATRPTLALHGLAISQSVLTVDGDLVVETYAMHTGGGSVRSGPIRFRMPPNPQQIGSWITYIRRYQLCAFLGIAPDGDDDDAKSAAPEPTRTRRTSTKRTAPAPASTVAVMTDMQRRHIMAMFAALGLSGETNRQARLEYTSNAISREVESTNDLTGPEVRTLIESLIADTQADDEPSGSGYD